MSYTQHKVIPVFVCLICTCHARRLQPSVERWSNSWREGHNRATEARSLHAGLGSAARLLLALDAAVAFNAFCPERSSVSNRLLPAGLPTVAMEFATEVRAEVPPVEPVLVKISPEEGKRKRKKNKDKFAKEQKQKLYEYRFQLKNDPDCDRCLQLLDDVRSDGLLVTDEFHNFAMRACRHRLDVVETLFAEVAGRFNLREGCYTALLEAQVENDELQGALKTLNTMLADKSIQIKPRSCGLLLRKLFDNNHSTLSREIWNKMLAIGVELTPREHDARVRMHGRLGNRSELCHSVAELLALWPTPDEASLAALRTAIQDCESVATVSNSTLDTEQRCSCCGAQLQLLGLTVAERAQMREVLLQRAAENNGRGKRRRIEAGFENKSSPLEEFQDWLSKRPPFDYVLDGPNLGFNGQNYQGGHFRFKQIQNVIDAIKEREPNARILVLLSTKYLRGTVIPGPTHGRMSPTKMTKEDTDLVMSWHRHGMLYECSRSIYDDWYWMFATVADAQFQEPNTPALPRTGITRVITNDTMRDHWVDLLPRLAFNRWRHSQVLGYYLNWKTDNRADAGDEALHMAGDEVLNKKGSLARHASLTVNDDLSSLTVMDLKAKLKACSLKVSGTKLQLIERLKGARAGVDRLRQISDLRCFRVVELKATCKDAGLSVSGTKLQLIDRLESFEKEFKKLETEVAPPVEKVSASSTFVEKRIADDGKAYSKQEFIDFFGDYWTYYWDAARPSGEQVSGTSTASLAEETTEKVLPPGWGLSESAVVDTVPTMSVAAQIAGSRWHVPIPDTDPQQWLCMALPSEGVEEEEHKGEAV